jgi:hypothetical protein
MTALYAVIVILFFAQYLTLVKCRHFYQELKSKNDQLKSFAVSDDEQLKCMLELTDTPLAKRLLAVANNLDHAAVPLLSAGVGGSIVVQPGESQQPIIRATSGKKTKKINADSWDAFIDEISGCAFDEGKLNALHSLLRRRYRLNLRQRSELMNFFAFDEGREQAAKLMDSYEETDEC